MFLKASLSLLLVPLTTAAQPQVRTLSIDELFRLGIENSLRMQASRIGETLAGERAKSARSERLPGLNVGLSGGYLGQPVVFQQGLTQATRPDTPNWSNNYNIDLSQPLYEGGKIRYSIRQADLERQIASLSTENDRAEIKMLLLQQYVALYNLYKQTEVLQQNIDESTRRLEDIRRMRNEGLVTRNDEIRSDLQLTNDRLALREARNDICIVSQQLDVVLGLDETLLIAPDTALLYTAAPVESYQRYVERAYANYPELKIARENTSLARNDIRIARANYLPTLSLHGANTLARPITRTMQDTYANNWNIGLALSYNLSSLYRNRHRVEEARHAVSLRENAEQQVMQAIRVNVRRACTKHQEALERVQALMLAVRQADENYRIVHNRYLNQLSILTDLLDASRVRLEAQMQLTAARAEVIYTYYQLLQTCGSL